MSLRLQFAAISDVGRVRKDNQDSGYGGPWLLAVCDGVGGAARGDVASATAITQLRRLDDRPSDDLLGQVAGALHRAHDRIGELVEEDPALDGTSTTATVALFDGERIGVGHIGDSRAYLFRGGNISQLTKDHTFVQTLIDEGRITDEEARVHPHRNLILKALDGVRDDEPDLFTVDLAEGDRLLLCSDGACGVLDDGRIADILSSGSADYAAVELVRASLEAGSSDNVTCVVADLVDAEAAAGSPDDAPAPILVGAAADLKRRRGAMTGLFRGHRSGDTGELEPVTAEIPDDLAFAIPADPIDPEEARYAPRPPRRFTWLRRLLAVAIVVGLGWIAAAAAWSWSQEQYYVGESDGVVTIYRGLNTDLPGVDLSSPYETTNVELDRLSEFDADKVREGIEAGNLSDARSVVENLAEQQTTEPQSPTPSQPTPSPAGRWADMSQTSSLLGFVHRRRRGAELFLLVLALAVGIGAYAAVGLGVEGEVPADIIGYGGWLAALVIAAHVVVRLTAPYADPVLLPVVAALNGLGLAVIHRLDLAFQAEDRKDDFAQQQLVWMTLGVALFILTLVLLRDHRVLQRITYTLGLTAIVLLLLPMVPGLGTTINGARIWINVGPFSFQPGEIAKVLLVVAFAGYLVLHRDALALAGRRVLFVDLPRGRDLGPILAMWLLSLAILVFQRDLGSSLLFFGLFLIMLYVATERPGWLVVGAALFFGGALIAYQLFAHVQTRVNIWLDPFAHYGEGTDDLAFQPVESMFGMGWGGLIGRGFGEGSPERVPYANSDFIVAAIGEELGLTAVIAVILIYGIMVERALRAALVCRDGFGKLIATGLAGVLALQVFVVIGGVTRLIPLTGLTTPFLSYGGSSLVANWVIIALLLRISDQARRPVPSLVPDDDSEADSESTQVVRLS